jgi:hypothetical protein
VIGGAALATDATRNRLTASFGGGDPFTAAASGINSLNINFGGLAGPNRGRDTFVDDKTYAAAESPTQPSQVNGASLPVFPDPNEPRLGLVSSSTVPINPANFAPGVTFCDCQYLSWGYWTGQLNQVNSSGSVTRSDRAFINTYVVGVPTSAADINALHASAITGTYSGHAIGSVFNNGSSYVAAGNFNASYNFASQTGSFAISNFDGRNLGGSGPAPLSGANYGGVLSGSGLSGQFAGTFYGPQAANTGGTFAVRNTTGTPYFASGIFAGKR